MNDVSAMFHGLGPQGSNYWLALTSGRRTGPDKLRFSSLAVFSTSAVVDVIVSGSPFALIRNTPDTQSPALQHQLGAAIRVGDPPPPPRKMSFADISTWCRNASHADAQSSCVAVPVQLLSDSLFRWQSVDAINPFAFQPDALIMALANTVRLPNQGAAPGWPTLHRTVQMY